MQIGMVGLGRMGSNMARRMLAAGQACVAYDIHPEAVQGSLRQALAAPPRSPTWHGHLSRRARSG